MLVFLSILAGMHLFLYLRLKNLFPAPLWKKVLKFILLTLFLMIPISRSLSSYFFLSRLLVMISYIWIGFLFYGFLFLFLALPFKGTLPNKIALLLTFLTIIFGVVQSFRIHFRTLNLHMTREGCCLLGGQISHRQQTSQQEQVSKQAHSASTSLLSEKGQTQEIPERGQVLTLKVVFLSDLHISIFPPSSLLKSLVDQINSLKPDLILIGGDIIEREGLIRKEAQEILKGLKAQYGIFAVTGNHEKYTGPKALQWLQEAGIRLLRNEVLQLRKITLIGVDDEEFLEDEKALLINLLKKNRDRPFILLKHRPTHLSLICQKGIGLILSGHTHRGQLFPLHYITSKVYPFFYGLYKLKSSCIYVSSGVFPWGPPLRIGAPGEIVLISLTFEL